MLDSYRLRLLVAVADTGSIAGAAAALGCSAAAASQQLAVLEREARAQLLERSARSVRLSSAGQVLTEHARRIITDLETAAREVAAAGSETAAHLRIASFATGTRRIMAPAMIAMRRRHPLIDLTFTEIEPEDSIPAVAAGQVDVALTHQYAGFPGPTVRGLHQQHVLTDPLLMAVPATSPPTRGPATTPITHGPGSSPAWGTVTPPPTRNPETPPSTRGPVTPTPARGPDDPPPNRGHGSVPSGRATAGEAVASGPGPAAPEQGSAELRAYAEADWISGISGQGFQAVTEMACHVAGFEPRIRSRADTYTVILDLVAAGLGVALVPRSAAAPRPGVTLLTITAPANLARIIQVTTRASDRSPAVAAFRQELIKQGRSGRRATRLPAS